MNINSIPGGWITILVGAALVISYGESQGIDIAKSIGAVSLDPLENTLPGGLVGAVVALGVAGYFLNGGKF